MTLEEHVLNRISALIVLLLLPILAPLLALCATVAVDRSFRLSLFDSAVMTCEMLFTLLTGQLCEIKTDRS